MVVTNEDLRNQRETFEMDFKRAMKEGQIYNVREASLRLAIPRWSIYRWAAALGWKPSGTRHNYWEKS